MIRVRLMAAMVFSALFLMMWTFSATAHAVEYGSGWHGQVVAINQSPRVPAVKPVEGPAGLVPTGRPDPAPAH